MSFVSCYRKSGILILLCLLIWARGEDKLSEALISAIKDEGDEFYYFHYVENPQISETNSRFISSILAMTTFENKINKTGWSFLSVSTSASFPDYLQAYWAGFLEANLTYDVTSAHYENTVKDMCVEPLSESCNKLKIYLGDNMAYMINQTTLFGEHDPYWYQIKLQLWQFKGISDAFNQKFVESSVQLTKDYLFELVDDVLGIYLIQLSGDLWDLVTALSLNTGLNHINKLGHPTIVRPSCSALVKLVQNDVFFSHVTWAPYSIMLRVIKHYNFPWSLVGSSGAERVPGSIITFTSYPSVISSIDDFYLTSAKLAITETTNGVYNSELWKYVRNGSRTSVFVFLRAMAATRLAKSSKEWVDYFSKYNSGTYNNQWIVLDAKLWNKSGLTVDDGALVIAEQLPGIVSVKDVTFLLKQQTYWPSYNLPYLDDIYNLSGTRNQAEKFGDWYVHNKTARAQLFRRDHHKVKDLASMYRLMRYNDFMNDPLSKCACVPPYTGENAISARSDLNDPFGYYPIEAFSYRLHGGTDVKIVNLTMINQLNLLATSSPTYEDVPPFQWSNLQVPEKKPLMHPDKWQFTPILTEFVDYPSYINKSINTRLLSFKSLF